MDRLVRPLAAAGALPFAALIAPPASAEVPEHGGIRKNYHRDGPASASVRQPRFSTVRP